MTMYGTASAPPNVDSSGILAYWPIVWVEVLHISQFSWEITMSKKVSQSLMMLDAVATDWPEGRESRSPNARSWPRLQSGSQSEIEWRAQLRALKGHQAKSRSRDVAEDVAVLSSDDDGTASWLDFWTLLCR